MAIDTLEQLREHFLFTILNDAQFARVQTSIHSVTLTAEKHLFHFGDQARYFFLLRTGQIQLYRLSPGGEEKVIEIIHPGQTFAEAVMFLKGSNYPVSSKAVLDSVLWRIDMAMFRGILQESNELCLHLLGNMSRRLHSVVQDIEQLTLQNASMRVIQLLLQSAPDNAGTHYQLEWETPKQILASRLSIRPETFSRILQRLSRKGLIVVQGKTIEILDARRLQQTLETVD
jgi:CRP/FNR family transcriptional regulator, dissimilatory nitrate respiration regulator